MIIYVNGEEHSPKTIEELILLIDEFPEGLNIGKCVVCGHITNNMQKGKTFVCTPECLGG